MQPTAPKPGRGPSVALAVLRRWRTVALGVLAVAVLLTWLGAVMFGANTQVSPPGLNCQVGAITELAAIRAAENDAALRGFDVEAVEVAQLVDTDWLAEELLAPRFSNAACIWYVVLSGSQLSDALGGPLDVAGPGPTATPVLFTRMGVGIDSVSGYACFSHWLTSANMPRQIAAPPVAPTDHPGLGR